MRTITSHVVTLSLLALLLAAPARAQDPAAEKGPALKLVPGPVEGALSNIATIKVPEGVDFADKSQMPALNRITHNLDNPNDIGALISDDWIVFFNWDESGYVKDDDKSALDADKLMATFRESEEGANAARKEQGFDPMYLVGWHTKPFYDPKTNNLTWAVKNAVGDGQQKDVNVNHEVRLLGRRGVVSATLVASPAKLEPAIKQLDQMLTGFAFNPGQKYGEYRQGDKVAEYGLAGLVLGGGAVMAAKTGLLAKLGKFIKVIVLGGAAALASVGSWLKRKFGSDAEK